MIRMRIQKYTNKMATDAIVADAGVIYKRFFNHRPVIQNEVYYYVQEFETKRGDNDRKLLKDTLKLANEMDSVFLEDMERNKSFFSPIKSNLTKIIQKSDEILQNKEENLDTADEEKRTMADEIEELRVELNKEKEKFDSEIDQKISKCKEEIDLHRDQRDRLTFHQLR